jgi:hypothetical protein
MTLRKLKVGAPVLDVVNQNLFWNKIWFDNPENVGGGAFEMKFARMWHHDAVVLVGNALARATIGSDDVGRFPYHRYWGQSAAAINDSFENYFTLDAGTYDFVVLCRTASNSGIVSWRVDGVLIGTTDIYHGTGADLTLKTIVGVTISTDGNHTLTGTVSSKNASSSAYNAFMYKYHFRRQ